MSNYFVDLGPFREFDWEEIQLTNDLYFIFKYMFYKAKKMIEPQH